jgi:teichuronic acid biosynthesis glycosyltransferase TuaH
MVVIRAGTSFGATRLADQHVAEHLVAAGVPVLYVDPPISALSPRRDPRLATALEGPALRLERPGLARLTPRVFPGKSRGAMVHVTDALVRRHLRRAYAALGGDVRAELSVASRPGFARGHRGRRVFWVRDDFGAGAALMNLPRGRVERDQLRMAQAADLVVAVSPALVDAWRELGFSAVLVPNGCDVDGLAAVDDVPPAADIVLDGPVLGVVGTLGDRIDFTVLRALVERGHSLLLVGARQKNFAIERVEDLLDSPRVQWVGARPYAELPAYLRRIDVGLVPYTDSPFNRASFPLKTLEYLAAGRAVVSTDLPATRWLDTDLIRIGPDGASFCAAVDEALWEVQSPMLRERRRAFAAGHDWATRTAELLTAVG